MPKGYVYILECSDGSYYTGSTIDIGKRFNEHQNGLGANHTKKRLPVALVYLEEFKRIDEAFLREKQIQGWSRAKKVALIRQQKEKLPELSMAYRDKVTSRTSVTTENTSTSSASSSASKLNTDSNSSASRTSAQNIIKDTSALEKPKPVPEALEGTTFTSQGKLLLTAEYVVLDGAVALALPTRLGQSLVITPNPSNCITWKSFDNHNNIWFETTFTIDEIHSATKNETDVKSTLLHILKSAQELNPKFLKENNGFTIETRLQFPRLWGLGTSSTLINNIANWAKVNAYQLLERTFGGSGYDIACAEHKQPISYQLLNENRVIKTVDFNPSFKSNLYFVYLNQKQNSRDGIAHYKANRGRIKDDVEAITNITKSILNASTLDEFEALINEHEQIIANITKQTPVKTLLFSDFKGAIKSLGAWGGDFVLVTSKTDPSAYFNAKGYTTVLNYTELI